jgi:hypothetical protein
VLSLELSSYTVSSSWLSHTVFFVLFCFISVRVLNSYYIVLRIYQVSLSRFS